MIVSSIDSPKPQSKCPNHHPKTLHNPSSPVLPPSFEL